MGVKNRLVMVLSYLESIEDPYQYGDNYGDLVEYLKMLIEGEEEYVPEEDGRVGKRDSFEKHLKDSDYWKYPKFIEWVKENAVRPEVTDDGKIIVDKEAFEETGSWGYSNKKNPFNFSPKTLKWIEDNAVEPERTKHGIIIEGSFDGEDYLTDEDQAIWGLNPHNIPTTLELNERSVDELTKKLNDIREKTDLAKEEYAHARWKKEYKNKDYHTQIQAILKKLRNQGVYF